MPSIVDKARLMPASEDDLIEPGSCFLACLNVQKKTDPESYWIVLRSPREWLPDGFFDTRPVQIRVFPFWIVGKKQRVWLPRSSLFYLDKSQLHIFVDRQKKLEFANLLTLATTFCNKKEATKHFEQEILDSTKQYNERRERVEKNVASNRRSRSLSSFMEEYAFDSAGGQEDGQETMATDTNPSCGGSKPAKRQRRESTSTRASSAKKQRREPTLTRTSPAQIDNNSETEIKTEQEERRFALVNTVMNDQRVRLYVGPLNTEFAADVAVLERSCPLLHSLINVDEGGQFIMHPRLRNIDTDDFFSMLQFMQTGEYEPTLVRNPDGDDRGPLGLDGKWTVDEYSDALVQAGRLFLLARMLQVDGMTELIVRKVTQARYKQYSNLALIEFGRIMFTRPANDHGVGNPLFEPIDRWAVIQLAENFMQIMRSEVEHNKYLEMIDETVERKIHAYILERAANDYRKLGGLPVIIEDEE